MSAKFAHWRAWYAHPAPYSGCPLWCICLHALRLCSVVLFVWFFRLVRAHSIFVFMYVWIFVRAWACVTVHVLSVCGVHVYAYMCVYVCAVQFADQYAMCWHDFECMNSYLLQGVVRPSPHLLSCASTVTTSCSINLIAILTVSLSEQRDLLGRVWISAEQSEMKPEDFQFLKNSSCKTFARNKYSFQTQSFTSYQKMRRFGRLWVEIRKKFWPRCAGAKQEI